MLSRATSTEKSADERAYERADERADKGADKSTVSYQDKLTSESYASNNVSKLSLTSLKQLTQPVSESNLNDALAYLTKNYPTVEHPDTLDNYNEVILDITQILRAQLKQNEALSLLRQLRFSGQSPILKAKLLNQRGVVLLEMGYYSLAATEFFESVDLLSGLDEPAILANVYISLGTLHHAIEDYDRAIRFYTQAERLTDELTPSEPEELDAYRETSFNILVNTAISLARRKRFDEALELYEEALDQANVYGDLSNAAVALYNIGNTYVMSQSPEKAIPYFRESMDLVEEQGNRYGQYLNTVALGVVQLQFKNYDESLQLLMTALKIAQENNLSAGEKHIYEQITYLYEDMNNVEMQQELSLRVDELADSLLNAEDQLKILSLTSDLEMEIQERQLSKQVSNLRKVQNRNSWFLVITAFLSLLVIGVVVHYRRRESRRQALFNKQQHLLSGAGGTVVSSTETQLADAKSSASDSSAGPVSVDPSQGSASDSSAGPVSDKAGNNIERNPVEGHAEGAGHQETDPSEIAKAEKMRVIYAEVLSKIEKEHLYTDPDLTLNQLSASVGSNYKYVSEAINIEGGVSYYDLVNKFRIEEACRLMSEGFETQKSTYELMELSGFKNSATFYRVFKKHTGMTPKQFRNQVLKASSNQ